MPLMTPETPREARSEDRSGSAARVLFLGITYAGWRTRVSNLESQVRDDPRIAAAFRQITGWREGGVLERLPLLPRNLTGRARAVLEAAAVVQWPRPDAIWTAAGAALTPYLWSQLGRLRRPMVLDLDWTLAQQEEWAPVYYRRQPKRGVRWSVARLQERALWRSVTLLTPMSRWAAESLERQGVDRSRIRIIPPGVDLTQWRPTAKLNEGRLRLLFVGGDFWRKGGDLLIEAVRALPRSEYELDVVTQTTVEPVEGVRFHRAEANSPELRRLYAKADLFVMPSRADCLGIATIEAMASGLPVIAGDVGGVRDLVSESETGWLVQPTVDSLVPALEAARRERSTLPMMGRRARARAEERFDARKNAAAVIDVILESIELHRS